jgi:peptidoglycan/LPS O-acetylase OafA/YrhL
LSQKAKASHGRFVLLDAMRGVAAICVMFFHFREGHGDSWFEAAHARLAVDFFFLLSGFVIGRAYENQLLAGLSWTRFALIRSIRLGPMLWIGVISFAALSLLIAAIHHQTTSFAGSATSLAFALGNLPDFSQDPEHFFQILPPRWSLFYEMAVNLLYAATIKFLNNALIASMLVVTLATLLLLDPRWSIHEPSMITASCRTIFSFLLGVLIYRLFAAGRLIRIPVHMSLLLIIPIVLVSVPANGWVEPYYAAFNVAVIFPVLTIAACFADVSQRTARFAEALGDLSYPLYLLHIPGLLVLLPVLKRLGLEDQAALILSLPMALASLAAARWLDTPIRGWLSRKFLHSSPRPALQTVP